MEFSHHIHTANPPPKPCMDPWKMVFIAVLLFSAALSTSTRWRKESRQMQNFICASRHQVASSIHSGATQCGRVIIPAGSHQDAPLKVRSDELQRLQGSVVEDGHYPR